MGFKKKTVLTEESRLLAEDVPENTPVKDCLITHITTSVDVRLNVGNYESVSLFASATADIVPGADVDEAYKGLYDYLRNDVLLPQIKDVREKTKSRNSA